MTFLDKINTIEKQLQFGSTLKSIFGTAFSFVIGFAWRDAIKELIEKIIDETKVDKSKVWHRYPHTMYALFITMLGVVLLYLLGENKFNVKK